MECRKYFPLFVIVLLPAWVSCANPFEKIPEIIEQATEPFRLPTNVYPVKQWVEIYTSLDKDDYSFWGRTTIIVDILEDTKKIVLHSSGLNIDIDGITVIHADQNQNEIIITLTVESADLDAEYEFLIITVKELLKVDHQYTIRISFSAKLLDASYGYFRTCYDDPVGRNACFATSYFHTGMARRAFPLFDEPMYQCIFSITLAHSSEYRAISNMNIISTIDVENMSGWVADTFADTPKMPGYLVAMMICQFDDTILPMEGIPVRVWARTEVLDQLRIVEETVKDIFPYFNNLFRYQYPLPKLDVIAVLYYSGNNHPSFGCIMMDETNVVFNEFFHTIYDKTNIAAEVSRMLASQWVENIVSIAWWNEVNLARGLAYFYQEMALVLYMNSSNLSDYRLVDVQKTKMIKDSLVGCGALAAPIDNKDPMTWLQNLDFHSGYMLFNMLFMIVGNAGFIQGVANYLEYFHNAIGSYFIFLWALADAGGRSRGIPENFNIHEVMAEWIFSEGYPMVKVQIDYGEQVAHLSQVRFLSEPRLSYEERTELEKECWTIPISLWTSNNDFHSMYHATHYLPCDTNLQIPVEGFTQDHFLLVNLRFSAPYRVFYPELVWQRISEILNNERTFEDIFPVFRMQLISDCMEIAWPGYMLYQIPFTLLQYLAHENMEHPWNTALFSLKRVRDRLRRTKYLENFDNYVQNLLRPHYMKWDDVQYVPENFEEARFKLLIDEWSCFYGLPECLQQCSIVLNQWVNTKEPDVYNPINLNIRKTCYCYGIREGDSNLWSFMLTRFLNSEDTDEKTRILTSLGCTTNKMRLKNHLRNSANPKYLHPSWLNTVVLSIYDSGIPITYNLIFNFFVNKYEYITAGFHFDLKQWCPYLEIMGNLIETDKELESFEEFLSTANSGSLKNYCQKEIDTARRAAQNNSNWHDFHNLDISLLFPSS